ncbi:MAG: hypothetical protein WBP44_14370 [Gammaproteobacteria bacterium]|jgi:hypothetical protein
MNSDSGNPGKVFTLNRNERSRSTGMGVHLGPEYAPNIFIELAKRKNKLNTEEITIEMVLLN